MRVNEVNATFQRQGRQASDAKPAPACDSRALVVQTPSPSLLHPTLVYRQADFLAHLIATKTGHPQTRERRRAAPEEALAAYRTTVDLMKKRNQ